MSNPVPLGLLQDYYKKTNVRCCFLGQVHLINKKTNVSVDTLKQGCIGFTVSSTHECCHIKINDYTEKCCCNTLNDITISKGCVEMHKNTAVCWECCGVDLCCPIFSVLFAFKYMCDMLCYCNTCYFCCKPCVCCGCCVWFNEDDNNAMLNVCITNNEEMWVMMTGSPVKQSMSVNITMT